MDTRTLYGKKQDLAPLPRNRFGRSGTTVNRFDLQRRMRHSDKLLGSGSSATTRWFAKSALECAWGPKENCITLKGRVRGKKNHSGHRLEEKNRPTTNDRCRWRGIDSFLTTYFSSSFFHFTTVFFSHLFGEDFLFVRIGTMVGGIFSMCSWLAVIVDTIDLKRIGSFFFFFG